MNLVKKVIPPKTKGDRIIGIIQNFTYVQTGSQMQKVALELAENDILATAVVDNNLKVLGFIERANLENQLSKPYGRELLNRSTVNDIMSMPRTFLYNESVAIIIEHVRDDFQLEKVQYYILLDHYGHYYGIFSSRNMLLHSAETQKRDLQTAKIIQERLVPQYSQFSDDLTEFIGSAFMQQDVGGDYYYIKEYARHSWFFCLCDISGKGIAASIVVAVLGGYMWNADFSKPITKFIQGLNTLIVQTFNLEKYFTGVFCTFNAETGSLKYCDMGHGMIYRLKNKKIVPFQQEAVNMPVGIVDNISIVQKELILNHDETIILFSDGISEQENKNGIVFDIQNIAQSIIENPGNLKKAKIQTLETFYQFKDTEVQHDDISILFCHRK
jgi:sigma-B regulation protein RsbU (phosphoserine phosphatase)